MIKEKAKIIFLLISYILLLSNQIQAIQGNSTNQSIEREIEITYNFPDDKILTANKTYENIIKLENLNHTSGETEALKISLEHKLNSTSIHKSNHTINKYTTSNTGDLKLQINETITLCSFLESINFINTGSNKKCIELTTNQNETTDENNQTSSTCDCPLELNLNKKITKNNIEIDIDHCKNSSSTYSHPITYWIENLEKEIVKSQITTVNTAKKQFTPKSDLTQESFLLYAEIPQCNQKREKLFTKINENVETEKNIEQDYFNLSAPVQSDKKIVMIEIKGYKTTRHSAIEAYITKDKKRVSEISKAKIQDDSFNIQIPIAITKFEGGMHNIIVEGLDQVLVKRIYIDAPPPELPTPLKPKIISTTQKGIYFNENGSLKIEFENTYSSPLEIKTSAENKTLIVTQNSIDTNIKINHPQEIAILKLYNDQGNLIEQKYHQFNYEKINQNATSNIQKEIKESENNQIKNYNATILIITGIITLFSLIIYLDIKNNKK